MEYQLNTQTPSPPSSSKSDRGHANLREVLSTISVLVAALLVAWAMVAYVFQFYEVEGPSMQNTLQNHDRLIVWKAPRTWARITGHNYTPNRGDIVIFNESGLSALGQDNTKQLIKRVIGLPGDHVIVNNGTITIYNSQHPDGFEPDKTLPYGSESDIPPTMGYADITLDKNQIYVCGDNRPDSLDSRTFGPVSTDNIVGKLVARFYPFDQAKRF